jgi:AAA ATPase domain
MIPSPYTPGSVPLVLAGRDAQLAQVRNALGGVATYGHFLGRIRVETGSRGVGKTSLLKAVQDTAAEAGFVTVWATARTDESLAGQIAHGLADGLDGIGVTLLRDARLRDRIRTLELELGVGPAKAGVEVDVTPDEPRAGAPAATALRDLVTAGAVSARERGSAGVCVIVDELQAAPAADLRTVAYAWQEMQVQHDQPPAALFAAGLPNTPDVLTDAVTFSERFAFRPLNRLTDAEAADALTRTAMQARVSWAPGVVDQVARRAQGYPYFVQLYGDAIWQAAQPEPGAVLTPEHLQRADEIVAADTQAMFRARWAKATSGEQRLLTAMAQFGDAPVRRADLAARLGVSSTDLSVQRRRLLDKGLIETAGHGRLQFTTPGFAAFVRDETGVGRGG